MADTAPMAASGSPGAFGLAGRSAVVTGGSGGIGLGIARVLGRAGARVVITGRDLDNAQNAAAELREEGCAVAAVRLDPADEASILEASAEILERFGVPWALVNNAGMQNGELILEGTSRHWDDTYATNLRGPFLLIRELGGAMAAAGKGGRIVNISTRAVQGRGFVGLGAYVASKAGMVALSTACAKEFAGARITVNTVLPGTVITPGTRARTGPPPPPGHQPVIPPLGYSTPEEVAAAVLFFVSLEASSVTNQVLAVDGGYSVS